MKTVQEALTIATAHHRAGRLDQAEALYRRILDADPGSADALHLLGLVARRTGRPDEALALVAAAIAAAPHLSDAHDNYASMLIDAGRLEEALPYFERAIALSPAVGRIHNRLGHLLNRMGRHEEAVAAFAASLVLDPTDSAGHSDVGVIVRQLGRLDQACEHYRQAILHQPDFGEAHMNLSVLYKGHPVAVPAEGDIVLYQHHPGLGDNLIYSSLPELFARQGRTVWISDMNRVRNPGIHDLVWGANPHVKGISPALPNAGSTRIQAYIQAVRLQNLVQRVEHIHGFDTGNRYPRIYYQPKPHPILGDRIILDVHSMTGRYEAAAIAEYVQFLSKRFHYDRKDMVAVHFTAGIAEPNAAFEDLETYTPSSIFDYCDAIASCRALVTILSGANTLAAAIKGDRADGPALHCLVAKGDYNDKAYVWPNVDYVIL